MIISNIEFIFSKINISSIRKSVEFCNVTKFYYICSRKYLKSIIPKHNKNAGTESY